MHRLFSVTVTEIATGGQWKGGEERLVLDNIIEEGGDKQHGFRALLRSGEGRARRQGRSPGIGH
jgi:hypothetical protein